MVTKDINSPRFSPTILYRDTSSASTLTPRQPMMCVLTLSATEARINIIFLSRTALDSALQLSIVFCEVMLPLLHSGDELRLYYTILYTILYYTSSTVRWVPTLTCTAELPTKPSGTHWRGEINPPVLSTCPLHTNSGCGKERCILFGPW